MRYVCILFPLILGVKVVYNMISLNMPLQFFTVVCICTYNTSYLASYSYTMDKSGLPDMYTQSPRTAGPRAEGVHIRQTTSGHSITVMGHSHALW